MDEYILYIHLYIYTRDTPYVFRISKYIILMKKYAIQNAIFRILGELPVSPGCPIIVARSAVVAQMSY